MTILARGDLAGLQGAANVLANPISSGTGSWSCAGLNGGTNVNCLALVQTYTVTVNAGAGGSISPSTQAVASGNRATLTITPNAGYSATVTGCGGTLSGNTYTTGVVTGACTVSASFSNRKLINISTRGRVGTGDSVLIAGLIIQGTQPKQVLLTINGATLADHGVPDVPGPIPPCLSMTPVGNKSP